MRGHLFVFSGPAGAGKGTVLKEVFRRLPDIAYSVSCTTREPRPGEVDGVSYCFMDEAEFARMADEGMFLEWANVHGHRYGTRKDVVDAALAEGRDIVLEIDVQGAAHVKEKMPEAVMTFIEPPSFEELEKRLRGRGTETETDIERRLADARIEMSQADKYDHLIVNDTVDRAAEEFIKIVKQYREASK